MSTHITKPAPHSSLSNFMDLVAGITREMVEEWTIEHWQENTTQCKEALNDINLWRQIPLLNHVDEIEKYYEKVVRFRGMVQEICSPVYYLDQYVVLDHATNTRSFKSGKYRDTLACQENEEILVDSEENVHQERQVIFCVDTPSLNPWAYKISAKENQPEGLIDVTNEEMDSTENSQTESQVRKKHLIANGIDGNGTSLNSEIEVDGVKAEKKDENRACVVNLYDTVDETVKMNDIIEVAGFLAVSLSQEINEQNSENDVQISFSNTPQLHVIAFRPTPYKFHDMLTIQEDEILRNATILKREMIEILTTMLGNDDLAANYLLCNLISSVFRRQDTFILGKFGLNLTNMPASACDGFYTNQIYDIISILVEKSCYIPVEIDMFNKTMMTPRRDENEKFESGLLQLSSGTHIVVDETKLQPGRLQQNGIDSIAAISAVIKDQKVDFDFDYCKTEMPTDLPVLIFSHNRSLFPHDWLVALKPEDCDVNDMNTCIQHAKQRLCEPLLSQLRIYLDVVKSIHYELPPDMCKTITEDYVKLRQEGDIAVLKQDLNKLLVLARLISLSNGCGYLTKEFWEEALQMERQRKSRLSEEDI